MISRLVAALVTLAVLGLFLFQDRWQDCPDGRRYTSKRNQPAPFNRRFCGWNKRVLISATWVSLVAIGASMGDWKRALCFATLPGVWLCATRPTTVDGPSMALAWFGSMMLPTHPWIAAIWFIASGFIHERGPVFGALYAWSPWPLLAILPSMYFWRKPGPWDGDMRVGIEGLLNVIRVHKPDHDWLDWKGWVYPTRGLVPLALWMHLPLTVWPALTVATLSRLVGTDVGRFVMWGTLPLIYNLRDVPEWLVAVQALTFQRLS